MGKMDEQILVVPRKALFDFGSLEFQGLESRKDRIISIGRNISNNFGVMRRGDAEENETFKQPIPYAVIRRGHEVFVYERLEGGGEERLHGKLSIGAGGHMNLEGNDFTTSLETNLKRELEEELDIKSRTADRKTLGYINDDEDEVGRVHIGILVVIDLDKDATVSVRETDQLKGDFISINELASIEKYERLEEWSKIALRALGVVI